MSFEHEILIETIIKQTQYKLASTSDIFVRISILLLYSLVQVKVYSYAAAESTTQYKESLFFFLSSRNSNLAWQVPLVKLEIQAISNCVVFFFYFTQCNIRSFDKVKMYSATEMLVSTARIKITQVLYYTHGSEYHLLNEAIIQYKLE